MKNIVSPRIVLVGLAGVLIGAFTILGIRLATYAPPEKVHYHANFVVYINGVREEFKGPKYYEETAATECTINKVETPLERAHLHDNVGDVVHVEDAATTWGNFFQNIGWGIDQTYIKTDKALLQTDDQAKLVFVLNGEEVADITSRVIDNRDKLLVSYGVNQDATKQFKNVPDTAEKYNEEKDPEGCSGSIAPTLQEKLRHLF